MEYCLCMGSGVLDPILVVFRAEVSMSKRVSVSPKQWIYLSSCWLIVSLVAVSCSSSETQEVNVAAPSSVESPADRADERDRATTTTSLPDARGFEVDFGDCLERRVGVRSVDVDERREDVKAASASCDVEVAFGADFARGVMEESEGVVSDAKARCLAAGFGDLSGEEYQAVVSAGLSPDDETTREGARVLGSILEECEV